MPNKTIHHLTKRSSNACRRGQLWACRREQTLSDARLVPFYIFRTKPHFRVTVQSFNSLRNTWLHIGTFVSLTSDSWSIPKNIQPCWEESNNVKCPYNPNTSDHSVGYLKMKRDHLQAHVLQTTVVQTKLFPPLCSCCVFASLIFN